jgi:hypothetical protein
MIERDTLLLPFTGHDIRGSFDYLPPLGRIERDTLLLPFTGHDIREGHLTTSLHWAG